MYSPKTPLDGARYGLMEKRWFKYGGFYLTGKTRVRTRGICSCLYPRIFTPEHISKNDTRLLPWLVIDSIMSTHITKSLPQIKRAPFWNGAPLIFGNDSNRGVSTWWEKQGSNKGDFFLSLPLNIFPKLVIDQIMKNTSRNRCRKLRGLRSGTGLL